MSTNGVNIVEDSEMADCDGEKVVTMMDVLQEQQDFEDDANAVLGASDETNCTYSKGYIKRQAIYACITCCTEAKDDPAKRAGICLACSLNCHENHELLELYTKRNFRCDCGNPKFNSHPCQYTPNKLDLNENNIYNQNFSGLYCICHRPYPDLEASIDNADEMIQCIICEDWLHSSHLEATVPITEQYSDMICKACMENNEFLYDYAHLAVKDEAADVDVTTLKADDSISDKIPCNNDQDVPITNGSFDVASTKETENFIQNSIEKTDKIVTEDNTVISHANESTNIKVKHGEVDPCTESMVTKENKSSENVDKDFVEEIPIIAAGVTTEPENSESLTNIVECKDAVENSKKSQLVDAEEDKVISIHSISTEGETKPDNVDIEASKVNEDISVNSISTESETKTDNVESPEKTVNKDVGTGKISYIIDENKLDDAKSGEPKVSETSRQETFENMSDESKFYLKEVDKTTENKNQTIEHSSNDIPGFISSAIDIQSSNTEISKSDKQSKTDTENTDIQRTESNTTEKECDEFEKLLADPILNNVDIKENEYDNTLECNIETNNTTDNIQNKYIEHSEEKIETKTKENLQSESNDKLAVENNIETIENNSTNATGINDTIVPNVQENKRKLISEETGVDTYNTTKKPKLNDADKCVRPKQIKRIHKGATFWPSSFRQKLCTCNECISMYKDLSVLFLIDLEDTVSAYEYLGKEKISGATSQYEKGLEALSSLDRIQQINALTEYNKMRDKLLDFLKSFKDRQEVVKEEDIKAFFAGMKPKRESDGVYFCR